MTEPIPLPAALADDGRMTRLEVKMAFAEDLLDTLNATVARQQEQIELLAREVVRLRRQHADGDQENSGAPQDDRPPHY